MKKRLISLLLAVAMMVAMVPTAAFAGDEAGTVNSDLRINANGIPYNVSDETQNQSNQSVSGTGWKYTPGTYSSWLDLGVGNTNYAFDLSSQPALNCEVELYNGTISGGTFNEKISIPHDATGACTISGGVFHGPIYFSDSNSSASLKVTGGIFTDSANGFFGQTSRVTIEGGIFANDPRTENFQPKKNVYTLAVTDGLKIVTIQHDNQSVAVSLDKIFVLADTVTESKPLTLTLSDGTSETLTSATSKTLHKTLFIETNGKPNIDGMVHTSFSGSTYHSDTWGYDASDSLELFSNFSGSVGPNPVKCDVKNAGTITGGVFKETVSSYSSQSGTIQGGIFLGNVAADQNITGGVFVHDQVSGVHTVSSPAELGKIKTITLGNDTVTLDEPVDSFHFGGTPTNLSVTLEDGTVYHIDPSKEADGTVTLEPKPEEPDYYTVIVEGGEARNERGDILDSEVALTAGEKITLKLLDETQGEMVFSHWDVNNNDTDLADELAKTGFDKTAHETTFTMPAHNLTLTAKYRIPDEDAPQDDSFLMTAAAVTGGAVLTGLVVWQGYNIFSQVYLNAHLPEGTAIPTNRQQLALLLWNTAGQPEASAASYVFPDVADPDVQTAARWATEQGLFKARKDGTFAPTDSVTTGQVYRAWQKVK